MKRFCLLASVLLLTSSAEANCDVQALLNRTLSESVQEGTRAIQERDYLPLSRSLMGEAHQGKLFTYYVDSFDQVHLVHGEFLNQEDLLLLKKPGSQEAIIVKESGLFHYDGKVKKFVFEPRTHAPLTAEENEKLLGALEKKNPEYQFKREPKVEMDKSRVFNCANILSGQQQGKSFVWDSIVSSNVVTLSGMITQEIGGNHILTDPNKQPLAYADLIANNITTSITSPIVKTLVVKNAGIVKDFTVRTAADYFTNTQIKKPLYEAMTPKKKDEKESLGNLLVPYDTGFAIARFFPKRALDRYMVNKLPQVLTQACLEGKIGLVNSAPKLLRISDRFGASVLYLSGRNLYLNFAQ